MKNRIALFAVSAAAVAVIGVLTVSLFGGGAEIEDKTESVTIGTTNITALTYAPKTLAEVAHKETTSALTAAETSAQTSAAKTETTQKAEFSSFDNIAFMGNSRFISLKDYGLVPNVYPVVGLDVRTVFTKHVSGSDVAVINELDGRSYDAVVLLFGENETGWPNRDYFIKKYAEVIDAVKTKQPDAKIYLHSIIPVSSEASAKNECGCNNKTISEMNAGIKQLAEDNNVDYIDVPQCLLDAQGNLIDGAASDGIHLNKKYSSVWMSYLEKTLLP